MAKAKVTVKIKGNPEQVQKALVKVAAPSSLREADFRLQSKRKKSNAISI